MILNRYIQLVDVITGFPEHPLYLELICRLSSIFSYMRAGFLEDKEVEDLSSKCWDLAEWFPKAFPMERIAPKLHILMCHVPECASKFRTLGLLSERGIESIHAQINADERIYSSVRDQKQS